jgi:CheY-like chemotaxis protein
MALLSNRTARFRAFVPPAPIAPQANKTVFLVHGAGEPTSAVKAALVERGYHVVFAESAEAALHTWAQLAVPIDLFLADISLGKDQAIEQLVKLLQAENPRLRLLYANDLEQAGGPILSQSYPKQLVTVVDNCLA